MGGIQSSLFEGLDDAPWPSTVDFDYVAGMEQRWGSVCGFSLALVPQSDSSPPGDGSTGSAAGEDNNDGGQNAGDDENNSQAPLIGATEP